MSFLSGKNIPAEPDLLFDKSDSSAVHNQVYWGLRTYGPYDKDKPLIRLALIYPMDKKNAVQGLIQGLNNGTPVIPGGMPRFFRCKLDIVKEFTTNTTAIDEYEKVATSFIKSVNYKDVDTILVYIPRTPKYSTNTPYYYLKSIFTSHGFPTQMITEYTFQNLKWSYLNLASAIFSKAGGIPWVLASEIKNTDMILGISVSNIVAYKRRAGGHPRFVGCANVFDNYGKWMFFEGTAKLFEEDRSSRYDQLKELIEGCVRKFEAIKKKLPKNIVIHYFKKFGRKEIEATKQILNDIVGDYNLACVSINSSHPYRLYDKSTSDGSFPRGSYVYLRNNECLLSTTGETPIARLRMGTPRLLQIRLRFMNNNFLTMDDIVYQVFSLTKLNWATSMPMIREPVTLVFSREIAYLTAAMSEQEWRGVATLEINPTLNSKPWFI
jgi:argonaute-like protein implicated in RNA metabolism and viral defense